MGNTSGQGKQAVLPNELTGWSWNWGAFMMNWLWGIFNKTYIALLTLVPIVGLVIPFVLGFKGNAWAWRNKRWDSLEHFRRVQRKWTIWGIIILIVSAVAAVVSVFFTFHTVNSSEPYIMGKHRRSSAPLSNPAGGRRERFLTKEQAAKPSLPFPSMGQSSKARSMSTQLKSRTNGN
jgi:heme/copper-type cytochrome/quinol oxidase subunit 2